MTVAEQSCLTDALKAIQFARTALACGDFALAIFELCAANRWHAIATVLHQRESTRELANAAEVEEKLRALQKEIAASVRAPSARPMQLVACLSESLAVLRERGVAITDAQVSERARNMAMSLDGQFDVRQRPNPKGPE